MKHSSMMIIAIHMIKYASIQSFLPLRNLRRSSRSHILPIINSRKIHLNSCLHSSQKDTQEQPSTLNSGNICVAVPANPEHKQISFEIASILSAPLLNNKEGIDELEDPFGNELVVQSDEEVEIRFDNCIHISPYQYESLESYAIAIQPLNSISGNSKSNRRGKKPKKNATMQPFYIDFCPAPNSKLGKRLGKQGNQKGSESLLKAVAPLKLGEDGEGAVIFDLNAGFGQDSIIMALGGASKIHMVERDPIVGVLLSDAMRRLKLISSLDEGDHDLHDIDCIMRAKDLCGILVLHQGDSVEFSKSIRLEENSNDMNTGISSRPDVCYLDPMFPPRTKSAAVKKNMQILHGLFQKNDDDELQIDRIKEEQNLLEEALLLAKKRVVVKRPVTAFPLGIEKDIDAGIKMPSYELKGSVNRFDVYVI